MERGVRKFVVLGKVLVGIGLIALLTLLSDWRASVERLEHLSFFWTGIAIGASVTGIALSAWRWQLLVDVVASGLRFWVALRYYWIGAFFSAIMPSSVGGDIVRLGLARHVGGIGPIAASMLVERATGFAVLFVLAALAILIGPQLPLHAEVRQLIFMIVAAVAVALVLLVRTGPAVNRASAWLGSSAMRPAMWLLTKVEGLVGALAQYRHARAALVSTCLLSVLFYCLMTLFQFSTIKAVGGDVGLTHALMVTSLVAVTMALPVSINGIGVSEGAFVVLFAQVGVPVETGFAGAILRRVLITGIQVVGAGFWIADRSRSPIRAKGGSPLSANPTAK
jgi:uncharacterized protein (TIRG00374 family)